VVVAAVSGCVAVADPLHMSAVGFQKIHSDETAKSATAAVWMVPAVYYLYKGELSKKVRCPESPVTQSL